MLTRDEVENAFTYHAPRDQDERNFYEQFREEILSQALFIHSTLTMCPERTLALRHLEMAVMYANAGVARHGLATHKTQELPTTGSLNTGTTVDGTP
jgi:hypothetical protein